MAEAEQSLVNGVTNISVHGNDKSKEDGDEFAKSWGFNLPELYKLAVRFFKEKDGKALKLTYKDKLRLVAYTKQATYGKYRNDVSPEVGFLDVVGNDRRQAWQALGDMSQSTAMAEFVKQLDSLCPLFRPFTEAHSAEKQEQQRKKQEEEDRLRREAEEKERQRREEEAQKQLELQKQKQLEQEMQIRAALNQQTAVQFAQYAQQQYPNNKQQQDELIRQLQEQHYQQYMQQVYQQQLLHQQQQYQQMHQQASNTAPTQQAPASQQMAPPPTQQPGSQQSETPPQTNVNSNVTPNGPVEGTTEKKQEGEGHVPPPALLMPASIWTRKDIQSFKDSVKHCQENVIKIGSLATATVRVPTHEDGTCLFWEFATDYYDIGFGVYFEWTVSPSTTVSVTVSESSDEEEFDEEQDTKNDVEQGAKKDDRPPTDEIIPVYRRDCHEEVYCGSHAYPGQGVYLLKFDNSYSLWRSKTLYYRVYYSR
ncbi:Golgi resident protein GCP60-like isoform X3 [Saccostrea echinata]|uniref:Golgi resident protein GCP60-like isoform X3 n=1 Tax=Saccostrea echinata TaxID=191078 RepID=UPI002A8402AF|nr:Golgi resident protein GCP60-like isoform X3 [Saccostrea echinata]